MIRRAVILAAGVGSRLGKLTEELPKPLIPVGERSPLQTHLENCAAAGVTDVFINTHHLAEKIRDFVGDGSRFGLNARFSYEPELLGTSGALHAFRDGLQDGGFYVLYGDNLIGCDLRELGNGHEQSGAMVTIALHHREDVSTSGMVVTDPSGRILRFVEKPNKEDQVSHLVNAGIYAVSPELLDLLPPGESDFGKNIFPGLIERQAFLQGHTLASEVLPIDTPELLELARRRQSR